MKVLINQVPLITPIRQVTLKLSMVNRTGAFDKANIDFFKSLPLKYFQMHIVY